jgi:hypothetical protein
MVNKQLDEDCPSVYIELDFNLLENRQTYSISTLLSRACATVNVHQKLLLEAAFAVMYDKQASGGICK